MGSRRQLAATLGRIYPYRAAKQQAPGVAGADAEGFPNRSGMTDRSGMTGSPDEPGMTEGYYPAASGSFSHFEAGTESVDYQEYK